MSVLKKEENEMREILFRGKRVDNGEWVYGYYICKQDPLPPRIDTNIIVTFDENSMSVWNKVDPETIGQYTGLKDINENKVFEGDIMEFDAYGIHYCGVVTIISANACILCGEKAAPKAAPFLDHAIGRYEATVIGNIHDNPELLEMK